MDYYGFVWICEFLYGFLDSGSSSLSRVLLGEVLTHHYMCLWKLLGWNL